jgi:hypothetical protein
VDVDCAKDISQRGRAVDATKSGCWRDPVVLHPKQFHCLRLWGGHHISFVLRLCPTAAIRSLAMHFSSWNKLYLAIRMQLTILVIEYCLLWWQNLQEQQLLCVHKLTDDCWNLAGLLIIVWFCSSPVLWCLVVYSFIDSASYHDAILLLHNIFGISIFILLHFWSKENDVAGYEVNLKLNRRTELTLW